MGYRLEFKHDKLPPTVNQLKRMNRWQYKREREYWVSVIRFEILKNPPPKILNRYKLTLTRCASSPCDYDGLVGSFKVVVDSMQEWVSNGVPGAGLTSGDSMAHTGAWDCRWGKTKKNNGHIIVKVEEILDA